jgi:small subunit ribosomal protein S17
MRRRAHGTVKSDKMDKTITVVVERRLPHPRYGKIVRRRSTFKAHDPHNEARPGDVVEIEETRPLSKTKSWRLVRVVKRAGIFEQAAAIGPQEAAALREAASLQETAPAPQGTAEPPSAPQTGAQQ